MPSGDRMCLTGCVAQLFDIVISQRADLKSTVPLFRSGTEASSRNHRLINLGGRQGDKRGTTNCRYRAGAILHEHLSPEEVLGCASRRKVERRDLEDEARCLLGTSSSFFLSPSSFLLLFLFFENGIAKEGGEKKIERERERQRGRTRIGIEAIYLGIGFAVADSLHRSNDRGKGCHLDKRAHK